MDNATQLIALVIGLIGTTGGVLISFLTLKQSYDKDKHRVTVVCGKNLMLNVPGVSSKKEQLTVMIANKGDIPFTVANIGFYVGRNSGGLVIPVPKGTHQLPVILERDKTCNFWTDYEDACENIKGLTKRNTIKIRANVSDYAGTSFKSDWIALRFRETPYSKLVDRLSSKRKAILKFFIP